MIEVNITGENTSVDDHLYQYNYGQKLRMYGEFPSPIEIQFSLRITGGEAPRQLGTLVDGAIEVDIPDKMLRNNDTTHDYNIYVFLYMRNETSGETTHRIIIPVKSRPKPGDFLPPEPPDYPEQLLASVMAERQKAENAAEQAKKASSEAWEGAKKNIDEYVELKKEELKGETGDNGKSAYEYAIAGGYEGTEEEFSKMLAADVPQISELKGDMANKLDKPATAQVGQIFRVQAIREDGSLVIEAVDMPAGSSGSDLDYWASRDISNPDFEVNLEEDAAYLFIDKINGEAFEWDECMILANISSYVTGTSASGSSFLINAKEVSGGNMKSLKVEYLPTSYGFAKMMLRKRLGVYILEYEIGDLRNWSTGQAPMKTNLKPMFGSLDIIPDFGSTIKSLCINFGTSVGIPKGMHIRIYGKPVKGADA